MTDETIVDELFTDAELPGHEWRGVTFERCDFTETDLYLKPYCYRP
ncbi:MAG TPA: hypothetical protein VFW65_08205 [Pseudonocardiaceae bacterium]|nr:hypothetical protein [Pseudonocardiaceae bacterium]